MGLFFFVNCFILAWSPPTAPPPGDNVPAPLNVGSASQYKSGALGIGGVFRGYGNVYIGGNVGIGTTNPSQKLDVNGYVKGTGLCIGDDCKSSWPSGSGSESGWIDDGTVVRLETAADNVGIGTVAPEAKLHVAGKIKTDGEIEATGISGGAWDQIVNYYKCNDSDGGVNWTVAGTVTKLGAQSSDYCYNPATDVIYEYYCTAAEDIAVTSGRCSSIMWDPRYGCLDGRCQQTCDHAACCAEAAAACAAHPVCIDVSRCGCSYGACTYYLLFAH